MGHFKPPVTSSALEARLLTPGLLALWALVSFVPVFYARELSWHIGPWPFNFWMAAQGTVLVYIAIVVVFAWRMNRLEPEAVPDLASAQFTVAYHLRLKKWLTLYVGCLLAFLVGMVVAEIAGLSRNWASWK